MYQSYDLSRYVDGDLAQSNSFTVSDHDTVNCAHMLAAGFNTMSRIRMGGFVLAVVDTEAGTVQYDGKIEPIARPEPEQRPDNLWGVSHSFTFEPSAGVADTLLTLFGKGETPTFTAVGKVSIDEETDETTSAVAAEKAAPKISRKVLEAAYLELEAVKEVLFDAGVETIPADAGVTDLRALLRARDVEISELVQERANANAAARAELIKYVRGAYLKKRRLTVDEVREDLEDRFRGILDVFAKFLVVTGEADADEGHAVARRLCGINDE